jgi:hypothetical protein
MVLLHVSIFVYTFHFLELGYKMQNILLLCVQDICKSPYTRNLSVKLNDFTV